MRQDRFIRMNSCENCKRYCLVLETIIENSLLFFLESLTRKLNFGRTVASTPQLVKISKTLLEKISKNYGEDAYEC